MQTKNLLLFIVLSTATVIGWSFLQSYLYPPKQRPKVERQLTERERAIALDAASLAAAGAGGIGFDDVARLHTMVAQLTPKVEKPPVVVKPPVIEKPAVPPEEFAFGDDSFKLKVRLSALGASVREVVLAQFDAADELGLPMNRDGNRNTPLPLHLVPDRRVTAMRDNVISYDDRNPFYHYTLYHYEKPDDPRPVDTLGKIVWKVAEKPTPGADPQRAVFKADVPGQNVEIEKVFTLGKGDYHIGLAVVVRPKSGAKVDRFRYQLAGTRGLPIEGVWYTYTFRNAMIGTVDNKGTAFRFLDDLREVVLFEGGPRQPAEKGQDIRYAGVALQYFASTVSLDPNQQPNVPANFVESARATLESASVTGRIKSMDADVLKLDVGGKEQEFTIAPGSAAYSKGLRPVGSEVVVVWSPGGDDRKFAIDLLDPRTTYAILNDDITVRLKTGAIPLQEGPVEHKYVLYNGPVKVRLLGQLTGDRAVDPELVNFYEDTLHLRTLADYHSPNWFGKRASEIGLTWLIIKFTNLIHGLIHLIHEYTHLVYGLCIICVTVIVRGLMFPISRRQARTTMDMQEKMAKLAPEVKKLQEKYKDDMAGLNQARTELYFRNGINPLATLGGCLLLFAQMPIFLGLYYALQESIHFRLDSFLWMPNLAAPDMLRWWSESIPFISVPSNLGSVFYLGPFFNLLPIFAVALMIVQQKMMTPPPQDEQQEMQQKMMKWMMIVFGVMFYKVAAGLCIYFIASSLWGLTERKLLPKKKPETPGQPAEPPPPKPDTPSKAIKAPKNGAPESNGGFMARLKERFDEVLKQAEKQKQASRDDNEGRKKKKKK